MNHKLGDIVEIDGVGYECVLHKVHERKPHITIVQKWKILYENDFKTEEDIANLLFTVDAATNQFDGTTNAQKVTNDGDDITNDQRKVSPNMSDEPYDPEDPTLEISLTPSQNPKSFQDEFADFLQRPRAHSTAHELLGNEDNCIIDEEIVQFAEMRCAPVSQRDDDDWDEEEEYECSWNFASPQLEIDDHECKWFDEEHRLVYDSENDDFVLLKNEDVECMDCIEEIEWMAE